MTAHLPTQAHREEPKPLHRLVGGLQPIVSATLRVIGSKSRRNTPCPNRSSRNAGPPMICWPYLLPRPRHRNPRTEPLRPKHTRKMRRARDVRLSNVCISSMCTFVSGHNRQVRVASCAGRHLSSPRYLSIRATRQPGAVFFWRRAVTDRTGLLCARLAMRRWTRLCLTELAPAPPIRRLRPSALNRLCLLLPA